MPPVILNRTHHGHYSSFRHPRSVALCSSFVKWAHSVARGDECHRLTCSIIRYELLCSFYSPGTLADRPAQAQTPQSNGAYAGYICFQLYELQAGLIVSSIQRVADEGKCYSSRKPN